MTAAVENPVSAASMSLGQAGRNEDPSLNEDQSVRGDAVEWLMRLQNQPHDKALRAALAEWLAEDPRHRRIYEEMATLWGQAEEVGALRQARQRDTAYVKKLVPRHRRRWVSAVAGLAAAASIVLMMAPRVQQWLAADYQTGLAEIRDVVLDDGSHVALDAQSAVAIDYSGGVRRVRLVSGQAFFEVVPSAERPFVVAAGRISVRVTGTAFSVGLQDAGVVVAVRSGSVAVSEREKGSLAALESGQQVRVAVDGRTLQDAISPDDVAAWRERRLVVYDVPIRQVVQQIARHTRAVVVFGDSRIADSKVTASVDLREPEQALRTIVGLQYGRVSEISPYLIVVSSQ